MVSQYSGVNALKVVQPVSRSLHIFLVDATLFACCALDVSTVLRCLAAKQLWLSDADTFISHV